MSELKVNYKPISQLNISENAQLSDLFLMSRKSEFGDSYVSFQISLDKITEYILSKYQDQYVDSVEYYNKSLHIKFKDPSKEDITVNLDELYNVYTASNDGVYIDGKVIRLRYSDISSHFDFQDYATHSEVELQEEVLLNYIDNQIFGLSNEVRNNFVSTDMDIHTYGTQTAQNKFIYKIEEQNGKILSVYTYTPQADENLKGGGVIDGVVLTSYIQVIKDDYTKEVKQLISNDCWVQLNGELVDELTSSIYFKIEINNGDEETGYRTITNWNTQSIDPLSSEINHKTFGFPSKRGAIIRITRSDGSNFPHNTKFQIDEYKLYGVLQSEVLSGYVTKPEITDVVRQNEMYNYAKKSDLNSYVKKTEATYNDTAITGTYVKKVSQLDGKISVEHGNLTDAIDKTALLNQIYPVNTIYTTLNDSDECPLMAIPGMNWKWRRVANGRCLFGADTSKGLYTRDELEPGLPMPKITINDPGHSHTNGFGTASGGDCGSSFNLGTSWYTGSSKTGITISTESDKIYGKSSTVQPPALVVTFWERVS